MKEYLDTLKRILETGVEKTDRTGVGTVSLPFNYSSFNTGYGQMFPALTTKRLAWKSVIGELLGFIRGADNAAEFRELGCNVWNANANDPGSETSPNAWLRNPNRRGEDDLGRIYGVQWRRWEDVKITKSETEGNARMRAQGYVKVGQYFEKPGEPMTIVWRREIDQLRDAINTIIKQPDSRRIIISAWNPADMSNMALPPCHVLQHFICVPLDESERFAAYLVGEKNTAIWNQGTSDDAAEALLKKAREQFTGNNKPTHEYLDSVGAPKHRLDIVVYQRSADYILGSPFNIASYAAMINIVARITNTAPGELHYLTGDTHVYSNHRDAAREQLSRRPQVELPRLLIDPALKTLEDFETAIPQNFRLFNYLNLGPLKNPTPMAV